MKLWDALDIKFGDVISLVGGGGKTTLMFTLARELAAAKGTVVTTTTTKIMEPLPSETSCLILEEDETCMVTAFLSKRNKCRHITLAKRKLPSGKLDGISPELVVRLAGMPEIASIIVEADGAARKPLKAPNATEPVIPENTSLVIPVVGVEAVGCRLTEDEVFRPEIVSRLLGLPQGEVISAEAVALLMTHPQGIIKGCPPDAMIVPFINKVDMEGGLSRGRDVASKILALKNPRIERVVLGHVWLPVPVAEVILRDRG